MDVTSFGINHDILLRGIYVSRKDEVGNGVVTSFDIRMKEPNREMVMDTSVMHTLEHLMAVFFRSHSYWADKTVYIGPMGCRTGFYFLTSGLDDQTVLQIIKDGMTFVKDYEGEIPGTGKAECGNYLEHDLEGAKQNARDILSVLENWNVDMLKYKE